MSDYTIASELVKDPESVHGALVPKAALELRKLHPEIAGWEQCGVSDKGQSIIRVVVRDSRGGLQRYDPKALAAVNAKVVVPLDVRAVVEDVR